MKCATSPREALEAGRRLIGQWPHAKPPDPETYAASIAAVMAQYPLGIVQECTDPRIGLARGREFPPTVACIVEWCDKRLALHQALANYRWAVETDRAKYELQEYSLEYRQNMKQRLKAMVHLVFEGKKIEPALDEQALGDSCTG